MDAFDQLMDLLMPVKAAPAFFAVDAAEDRGCWFRATQPRAAALIPVESVGERHD